NTGMLDSAPSSVRWAITCAVFVVSTNVGAIPAPPEHECDAMLVPPGDAQQMAAAVRRPLSDEKLAQRLPSAGRRKAEKRDWEHVLPLWTSLFDSIFASKTPVRPS